MTWSMCDSHGNGFWKEQFRIVSYFISWIDPKVMKGQLKTLKPSTMLDAVTSNITSNLEFTECQNWKGPQRTEVQVLFPR